MNNAKAVTEMLDSETRRHLGFIRKFNNSYVVNFSNVGVRLFCNDKEDLMTTLKDTGVSFDESIIQPLERHTYQVFYLVQEIKTSTDGFGYYSYPVTKRCSQLLTATDSEQAVEKAKQYLGDDGYFSLESVERMEPLT